MVVVVVVVFVGEGMLLGSCGFRGVGIGLLGVVERGGRMSCVVVDASVGRRGGVGGGVGKGVSKFASWETCRAASAGAYTGLGGLGVRSGEASQMLLSEDRKVSSDSDEPHLQCLVRLSRAFGPSPLFLIPWRRGCRASRLRAAVVTMGGPISHCREAGHIYY